MGGGEETVIVFCFLSPPDNYFVIQVGNRGIDSKFMTRCVKGRVGYFC